mmetsp:Transcript_3177/g.6012  ORF Transcript_3177/g.6012 Transcript_3177/m.6012 type:complete len:144 (+) Transcript_3177:1870-2301(+)
MPWTFFNAGEERAWGMWKPTCCGNELRERFMNPYENPARRFPGWRRNKQGDLRWSICGGRRIDQGYVCVEWERDAKLCNTECRADDPLQRMTIRNSPIISFDLASEYNGGLSHYVTSPQVLQGDSTPPRPFHCMTTQRSNNST